MVGFLSGRMGLGVAIGVFAFSAYALMAVAAFMLPETKGKALDSGLAFPESERNA